MNGLERKIYVEQTELVKEVLNSGNTSELYGEFCNNYEVALAKKFKSKFAISTNSGTAALHCAINAIGLEKGDEILVSANAVPMTIQPLIQEGLKINFFDLDPTCVDYNFEDLELKISNKTKAIIPVYMWGKLPNINKLTELKEKYNLKIIEDAAQAHGTQFRGKYAGNLFDIGCFSTHQSKIISTGEGGFLLTNSEATKERIKNFKNNNLLNKSISEGFNYRISNLSAVLGISELNYFDEKLKVLENNRDAFLEGAKNLRLLDIQKEEKFNNYNMILNIDNNFSNPFEIHKILALQDIYTDVSNFGYKSISSREISGLSKQECPNAERFLSYIVNINNDWKKDKKYYTDLGKKISKIENLTNTKKMKVIY